MKSPRLASLRVKTSSLSMRERSIERNGSSPGSPTPAIHIPSPIAECAENGVNIGLSSPMLRAFSPIDRERLTKMFVDAQRRREAIDVDHAELDMRCEELQRKEIELEIRKLDLEWRLRDLARQTNELARKEQEVKRQEYEYERTKKARDISQMLQYAGGSSDPVLPPSSSGAIAALIVRVDALEKQWRLRFNGLGRVDAPFATVNEDLVHRASA